MIFTKSKFKTSVNIKLDLGCDWIQERYIPTPTHIESLKGILAGFVSNGSKSHIIVGSYGSGKSMIGTLVSNIVAKKVEGNALDQLIEKFNRVSVEDGNMVELLNKIKHNKKTFIPVIINGKQGRFREAVISSIYKAVRKLDFDFTLPSIVEEIKSRVLLWKEEYIETFDKFVNLSEEKNWNVESFLNDIEEYDLDAINWYREIYPSLTAGAEFTLSYNLDIDEYLKYILKHLDERGYGLFLVYDEFGRYLQSINKYETVEAMQDIQNIAELADHDDYENFSVLFITHRNLKQYFLNYGEEIQNEFNRIQGRYKIYYTHSDPATFIRLSAEVTEDYRREWNQKYSFETQIIKYDLFPELNGREIKSIIVENSFPLHPVTLFVLPRLANAVAQNERTLFTFLESDEKGGLKRYYDSQKTWYFVQNLFDYFEPAFQEFLNDSLTGKAYYKYLKVQKKVGKSSTSIEETELLKLISIWDIASLNNIQKLNKEFMPFALNWDINKVNKIISILESKKLIRYSLFNDNWEIFEGSSIDVNKKIEEVKNQGIDKSEKLELLSEILDSRFAYPKRYNDQKNMIRFATIVTLYSSELKANNPDNTFEENSDMNIFYIIPDDEEIEDVKKILLELSEKNERSLYVLPHYYLVNIDGSLSRLAAIRKLLEDKYFLNEDSIIEEELLKVKENILYSVREEMEPFTKFQRSYWFHKGKDLKIKSRISLSENLSVIMDGIFYRTPVINNESFNRRIISKQQLKAAKEVVNAILGINTNVEDLKGPSKLIYASVVKNNMINEHNEKEEIASLRKDLMDIIRLGKGNFTTLLDIFTSQPYGIRKPNIPILLASILKNDWKYLMFYHKDGSYINDLEADILYERMLDKPENYSFSYQSLDEKYKDIIKIINKCFVSFKDGIDSSYHPAVQVNRILLKWFRNLPKIVQKTNKLSQKALLFKEIIKKGEFEPNAALVELYELNLDENSVMQVIKEYEAYSYHHKNLIEETVFKLSNVNSFEELYKNIQEKSEISKVDNKLFGIILKSNKENWADRLGIGLVGVNREEWSDSTDEVFFKTVSSLLQQGDNSEIKKEYYEIKSERKTMAIPKMELSSKGEIIYSNIKTDLELMGRKLPKDEIKVLLYKLLVDYYDENK